MKVFRKMQAIILVLVFILSQSSGIVGFATIGEKVTVIQNFQGTPDEFHGGYADQYGFRYKNASLDSFIKFENCAGARIVRAYSANSTIVVTRADNSAFDLESLDFGIWNSSGIFYAVGYKKNGTTVNSGDVISLTDKSKLIKIDLNWTDLVSVEFIGRPTGTTGGYPGYANLKLSYVDNGPHVKPEPVANEVFTGETTGVLLAHDGMDGNVGPVIGQSTGFGFAGSYSANVNNAGYAISADEALRFPALASTQKHLLLGYNGTNRIGRLIDKNAFSDYLVDNSIGKKGTEIWASVLLKTNSPDETAVRFTSGGTNGSNYNAVPLAIGNLSKSSENASIRYWAARINADDSYIGDVTCTSDTTLIVVRFQFGADTNDGDIARIYVNPDLSKRWYDNQTIGVRAPSLAFNGVSFFTRPKSGSLASFDEIRIGTSPDAVVPLKSLSNKPVNRVRIYPKDGFASSLVGGKIVGSNDSSTNNFEDIYTIASAQESQWNEYTFSNNKVYRYVKFSGPDGTHGTLSELEFYNDNNKIEGVPFGTVPLDAANDVDKAFDGNVNTFYSAELADNAYVGLDIGEATQVAEPVFLLESKRYEEAQTLRISCDTPGAIIKYTVNGGIPTDLDALVYNDNNPVQLTEGAYVIKAVAEKEGFESSDIVVNAYGIKTEVPIIQSQSSMHIGNSFTDALFSTNALISLAISANYNHAAYKFTVPGAPPEWLWEKDFLLDKHDQYMNAFTNLKPDNVFVQNHARSPYDGEKSEVSYTLNFFNKAYEYNKDVQPWLYSYVRFVEDWENYVFGKNPDPGLNAFVGNKMVQATTFREFCENGMLYYEELRNRMDAQFPGKTILSVPIALGVANMYDAITNGEIPDMSNKFWANMYTHSIEGGSPEFDTHMNERGQYFISLMVFSCMYQRSPEGVVTWRPNSLTEEQAQVFQRIAWDSVKDYPYAMVSNLPEGSPVPTVGPTAPAVTTTPTPTATTTTTATPTAIPTVTPTIAPTTSVEPTPTPTVAPTQEPTEMPKLAKPKLSTKQVYTSDNRVKGNYIVKGATITLFAGNKSLGSAKVNAKNNFTITFKKQAPGITLRVVASMNGYKNSDAGSYQVKLEIPKISFASSKKRIVKGMAYPKADVVVLFNKKVIGKTKVKASGKFEVKMKKLIKKGQKITITIQFKKYTASITYRLKI